MRIFVCTVVHHPEDARILHRQIRALLDAGHDVTYVAPFRACNVTPWPEVDPLDVPRATGRNRLHALRRARRVLAAHAKDADLLLLHDPELLLAVPRRLRSRTVWDVHEDTAAALGAKGWLPAPLRVPLRFAVHRVERRAERRLKLLLAEEGYRDRFRRPHPVVPNTTHVPELPPAPPGDDRIIYVGQLSFARGVNDLIELARLVHADGITLDLVGGADADVRPLLRDAQREGLLRWYGFVPNDRALRLAEGALAGLSLLHDTPNYRHSMPTKVVEYMARGIPVVSTPNPIAARIVEEAGCGLVVPYEDPAATAAAVRRLRDDAELRREMGKRGHEAARARFHWPEQGRLFVAQLEEWAGV
ncbi:glycosyltransferase [Actinoallomurus spadix]|uniref:Glycosyl transferase family 1 domain-containing protein n=1 Tax=Actinoallomurus spadix TaxID=79912 RepID=A0ABP3G7D7_9ACTN|nr:glycosyltransferase [Actinoallomurus spadix]MCO5991262.1 glycosyltransferase [Actinoallomurus spadix]